MLGRSRLSHGGILVAAAVSVVVTFTLAAQAQVFPASAAAQSAASGAPTRDPAFLLAQERERQALEARIERRSAPHARAERRRSRTRFRNLSRAEARTLARRTFKGDLRQPLVGGLRLAARERLKGYLSDYTAKVTSDAAPGAALVQSMLPLRTENEAGEKEAVDLGLMRDGGHLESINPLANVHYGDRADEALRFPDSGVGIAPAGIDGGVQGVQQDDRVFYPEVTGDVDFVTVPTPGGAESSWILRTADAPEDFQLRVKLPAGAELRYGTDGAGLASAPLAARPIEVVKDGKVLGSLKPPTAKDADGEPIQATMAYEGDLVTVRVEHRQADVAYPVMLDPVYENYLSWTSNSGLGESGWAPNSNHSSMWRCFCSSTWGRGLYLVAFGNAWYGFGHYNQWYFNAPGDSYVFRGDFGGTYHEAAPTYRTDNWAQNGATQVYEGLWSPTYGYETAQVSDPAGNAGMHAPWITTASFSNKFHTHCQQSCLWGTPSNPAGRPGNSMIFGQSYTSVYVPQGYQFGQGNTFMGGAQVGLHEFNPPYRTGAISHERVSGSGTVTSGLPTTWLKDGSLRATVPVADGGLGVRSASVHVAGNSPVQTTTLSCTGALTNGGRCSAPGTTTAPTVTYPVSSLPEGNVLMDASARDAVDNGGSGLGSQWNVKVDRSGPTIDLSGDLATLSLDTSGRDLYGLRIEAKDGVKGGSAAEQRSGVASISVEVDGNEDDSFTADETCTGDSCPLTADYELDTDVFPAEGAHTVRVVAKDNLGNSSARTLNIQVPRDDYYAGEVAAWKADVEREVDDAVPAVPLTGPMPAVPTRWRNATACETSTTAMHDCYQAGMTWTTEVRQWLGANLATVTMPDLPAMPTFEYHLEFGGTARDLTRRMADGFQVARRFVIDPSAPLEMSIGFHEPVSAARLSQLFPNVNPLESITLTGIFDPGGADINGGTRVTGPTALAAAVESFYQDQVAEIDRVIARVNEETPADAEETQDRDDAVSELQAARTHLAARAPYVKAVRVRIAPTDLLQVLGDQVLSQDVKALALAPAPGPPTYGPEPDRKQLDTLSTNSGVVAAAARENGTAPTATGTAARQQTCSQKGQGQSRSAKKTKHPNPLYYAPSRLTNASYLGRQDENGRHLKLHIIHFRYANGEGLAWICGDKLGERGVEMEARVFPVDNQRWSVNWEDKDVGDTVVVNNMPEPIHQDDLAVGTGGRTDKTRYPDFAIVSQKAKSMRYRKFYYVHFQTDEGLTDNGDVIFNAQAQRRAESEDEQRYCGILRNGHYQSCMFSTTTTCYWGHFTIGNPQPGRSIVDWGEQMGTGWSVSPPGEVGLCDPKPPGADDPG